jgi:2-keto-3-deoxy-L-rhamnonate aldolase RhmA
MRAVTSPVLTLDPSGPAAIGIFIKIPSLEIVDLVAAAGFDFVIMDTEHSVLSPRDVYALVFAYSSLGLPALVRLSDHGYGDGQRYLDAGAAGLMVPHVSDADEAREIMRSFSFPPAGTRGLGYAARVSGWGGNQGGLAEYVRRGDEDVRRIAMIEDAAGVRNLEDIVAQPGVDGVFVGAGDLALEMGEPLGSPGVRAVVDDVVRRCLATKVPVGVMTGDVGEAAARSEQGASFVVATSDAALLQRASVAAVAGFRAAGLGARP